MGKKVQARGNKNKDDMAWLKPAKKKPCLQAPANLSMVNHGHIEHIFRH
jgi:hypothetical protein